MPYLHSSEKLLGLNDVTIKNVEENGGNIEVFLEKPKNLIYASIAVKRQLRYNRHLITIPFSGATTTFDKEQKVKVIQSKSHEGINNKKLPHFQWQFFSFMYYVLVYQI